MDYKVTDTQLSGIADAIRSVIGTSDPIVFPSGFVSAVQDIPSPSGSIGISANGTYNVMSYASAVVDVPAPSGSINISQNGTFDVSSFANAVVSVEGGSAVLESLAVSQNGHYTPSAGIDGFDDVVVNVSGGGGSNDNFRIAVGDMSGSIYDTEASLVNNYAFYSHSTITGVEMTAVKPIGWYAFQGCGNLSTAVFPECSTIGESAFRGCVNLEVADFPKCETVGQYIFAECYKLSTVNFPVLKECGYAMFSKCSSLTEVTLPAVSLIRGSVFQRCIALSKVVLLSSSVCVLSNSATFFSTPIAASSYLGYFGSIYVPSSLVDAYKSANVWSVYSDRITAYVEP